MKWICACLLFLLASPAMGQLVFSGSKSANFADDFKLTIEPAWVGSEQPNTAGKSELEKKFFPGHNRMVEFFCRDSISGPLGFRIDTVSINNYIMEVVWMTDFKEEHTIERKKFPVSAAFFTSIWESYYGIIWNYTSRGIAPTSCDGYSVTFRCIVEDFSLWTFLARNPLSHVKELSTACNEMVKEVQENGKMVNEEKYIEQMDKLLREKSRNLKKKHPGERIQFL